METVSAVALQQAQFDHGVSLCSVEFVFCMFVDFLWELVSSHSSQTLRIWFL